MKHHSDERNGIACVVEVAGVKRDVEDVICVLPGVGVSGVDHHLVVIGTYTFKKLGDYLLGILAVVGLALIEVGVEVAAERRDRDVAGIHGVKIGLDLFVEVLEDRRRNGYKSGRQGLLIRRIVETLCRVAVVYSPYGVALEFEAVEHLVLERV